MMKKRTMKKRTKKAKNRSITSGPVISDTFIFSNIIVLKHYFFIFFTGVSYFCVDFKNRFEISQITFVKY